MSSALVDGPNVKTIRSEVVAETPVEKWAHWPIHWSGIWGGALAALAAVLLFGLVGVAVGAHLLGPDHRVVDLKKLTLPTLAFSVFGAFLAFVIGGWVAGKIAGILRSEPAMLHGALVWLIAVPMLVVLANLGAANYMGGWYAGLAGTPSWGTSAGAPFERPDPLPPMATEAEIAQFKADQAAYKQNVKQWQEDSPKVVRNSALGAITALLLGLAGSVIGGWLASGEPMTFTYHRNRPTVGQSHIRV